MTQILFENEEYTGKELSEAEKSILQSQVKNMLALPESFYAWLLETNYNKVEGALEVAKHQLDAPFTGMSANDSELGMQKIRPGHILRTTGSSETPKNDWSFTFIADSDYWIGYNTNNQTAVNIDKDLLLLVLGAGFTQGSTPVVEELYIQKGGTTYPVQVIRDAWAADNKFGVRAVPIRPFILVPKATCNTQVYSIAAGTNELVLFGLAFGLGRLLRTQEPSSVST